MRIRGFVYVGFWWGAESDREKLDIKSHFNHDTKQNKFLLLTRT